jgi:uncharacterized protein DUF4279
MSQISAMAGLRIMGTGLDLAAITHNLEVDPTHTHKKGDRARAKEEYKQDIWILNSSLDKKESLDAHLGWLAEHLSVHYDYLRSLKPVAQIDVFCSYTVEGDQGGFSLSCESLSLFVELGINFELSIISL